MATAFNTRKRIRRFFGHIESVAPMPNLIEVQKSSYESFLQRVTPAAKRTQSGLQEVFRGVFPIKDFAERASLEFVKYEFEEPKYDVEECQQRGITFAAPLKVTLQLVVWDIDEEAGSRSIRDIKEQDVYMGDMPLMTDNGTFIVNGTERVIVSQMHRSPGVFFDHDKGKTHSSGKYLFAARIIPYRGSWLDFEFDAKDLIHVRIDRRRKIPVTTLLLALDNDATWKKRAAAVAKGQTLDPSEAQGMSPEEILSAFYGQVVYTREKDGWNTPFDADSMRGVKLTHDLVNGKTGKSVADAGTKMTPRLLNKLKEAGLKDIRVSPEELIGRYAALDVINEKTGEIYVEAGQEITEAVLELFNENDIDLLPTLAIDHVNVGPYIRNTLAADKNSNREEALLDIYRVMRPGEPPTLEQAETLFQGLLFDIDRYDLSPVGRVKMNMRLDFEGVPDTQRTLRREDILAVVTRPARPQGRPRRDRRHRPSRQPPRPLGRRADGEPVSRRPAAHGAGDPRAHELDRHRHRDAARPDQRQAGGGGGARVLRLLAALAVHGPDQPAVGSDPQASPLGAWTGRSDPRARRLRGARRASDALRPHLPDRDAGRPEHRPDQLAGDLRAREPVRLHREPVPQGRGRPRHRRGGLSLGDGGGPLHGRPGQRRDRRQGQVRVRAGAVPQGRRVHPRPSRDDRLRRRLAQADRVGRRGADPVPRERRRQPRADGLEHAASGGAAHPGRDRRWSAPAWKRWSPATPAWPSPRAARGIVDQVDAMRIVVRATDDVGPNRPAVDIYNLLKFQRSNQSTCITQKPLVQRRRPGEEGRHRGRRPVDAGRRAGARPQRARRVHAVEWLQLRGLDPALRAHRAR